MAHDLSNLLEVLELLETNETLAVNLAEVPMTRKKRGVFLGPLAGKIFRLNMFE